MVTASPKRNAASTTGMTRSTKYWESERSVRMAATNASAKFNSTDAPVSDSSQRLDGVDMSSLNPHQLQDAQQKRSRKHRHEWPRWHAEVGGEQSVDQQQDCKNDQVQNTECRFLSLPRIELTNLCCRVLLRLGCHASALRPWAAANSESSRNTRSRK